jgi:ADP-ribosylglycohydrolase
LKNINKYRGCLIGGAAGDALGYGVEFLSADQIFRKYGKNGITEYVLTDGVAQISDDTQMTMFTANGLLLATTRGMIRGIMGSYPSYIALCYRDWLKTQTIEFADRIEDSYSWLVSIPELYNRRAPGNTCLSAIRHGANGSIEKPINNSKGCGGIMRVAPIGLYFWKSRATPEQIDIIGAETAALTHGHELGYIPAAALVHIIHLLSHDDSFTVLSAVENSMSAIKSLFPDSKHMNELQTLVQKAITLSSLDMDDLDAIRELGEGWVAEETLAIAIYCAMKHPNDFEKALLASVNHSGDSDSTGTVTGNIMGAHLGYDAIPQKYTKYLELHDIIIELADDLYNDCKISEYSEYRDDVWERKYMR